MADENVSDDRDTIPAPAPDFEHERLEHLAELITLYSRANAGELAGEPNVTTIAGRRFPLEAA
jgi:hypothetical protein